MIVVLIISKLSVKIALGTIYTCISDAHIKIYYINAQGLPQSILLTQKYCNNQAVYCICQSEHYMHNICALVSVLGEFPKY